MTKPIRIIFMGTPDFAVPSLRALQENAAQRDWEVVTVVTQPDRPAGRGKKVMASPVKQYAMAQGLPILQPVSLRKDPAAVATLRSLAPDLFVVAAYGQILRPEVLAIPTHGPLNVHASLLPAYRGASPITAALLDGQTETGVSLMLMDEGMDTGPVLVQARLAIAPEETAATLGVRLAELGAQLLVATLPAWLVGQVTPTPQSELPAAPSLCRLIRKEAGQIHWQQPALIIERMTRAYAPWPSAYTTWNSEIFKIWQATVVAGKAEPGLVIETADGVAVGTGADLLQLRTVQPTGKRRMDIHSFRNGAPHFVGSRLG